MARIAKPPKTRRSGPPANPARGEHSLTLGGVSYRLRPSGQFCRIVEDEVGALLDLFSRANTYRLKIEEAATIVTELIRAGAEPGDKLAANVTEEVIYDLIYEEGIAKVLPVLVIVLSDAVTGGRKASGEAKAVTSSRPGSVTAA
jgi:hypothetical protein